MRAPLVALVAAALLSPAIAHSQGAKAPPLDDATIVGIFDNANTWDISTGSLGARKATRQDVKDFGTMLVQAHTAVRQQGRDLAKKLGVTPTPLAKDFPLLADYNATMTKLNKLSGAEFDKAFLEHEVAYHKAVIDAVTKSYLPAIKNAELKKFVEGVAPAFSAHLSQAEYLLKK